MTKVFWVPKKICLIILDLKLWIIQYVSNIAKAQALSFQSDAGRFGVPVPCSCSVRSRSTSTRCFGGFGAACCRVLWQHWGWVLTNYNVKQAENRGFTMISGWFIIMQQSLNLIRYWKHDFNGLQPVSTHSNWLDFTTMWISIPSNHMKSWFSLIKSSSHISHTIWGFVVFTTCATNRSTFQLVVGEQQNTKHASQMFNQRMFDDVWPVLKHDLTSMASGGEAMKTNDFRRRWPRWLSRQVWGTRRCPFFRIGTWQFLMGLWLLYDGLMMGLWWFEMGDWDFMMLVRGGKGLCAQHQWSLIVLGPGHKRR